MSRIRTLRLFLLVCFTTGCATQKIFEDDRGDCLEDGDVSVGVQGLLVSLRAVAPEVPPGTPINVFVKLTGVGERENRAVCFAEIRWTSEAGNGLKEEGSSLTSSVVGFLDGAVGLENVDRKGTATHTFVLPMVPGVNATLTAEVVHSDPVMRVTWTTRTKSAPPAIALSSPSLRYDATQGGANPASQNVTVTNSGGETLNGLSIGAITYSAGATGWLQTPTLSSTTAPATLTVQPVTGALAQGTYTATIPVQSAVASSSPLNLPITLIVAAPALPAIALNPASLTYNAAQGGASPASQSVTITNSGGGLLSGLSIGAITYGPGPAAWLQPPTLNSTTAPATLTVQPVTGTLAAGTYTATVPVQSPAASNSPRNIAITFVVASLCTTIEDQFAAPDAGWTTIVTTSGVSPTQSASFQTAGGNPDGYRKMQHAFAGAGAISVYHYYGTTIYKPAVQGAIDHINYFEDQIELSPPSPGAAVGTGFSMMQGGTRYNIILRPPSGAFTNTLWETTSRPNLRASDFPGINFTQTGEPITFGYFRSNSNTGGGSYTITHGIDNWRVEVCRLAAGN